MFSVTRNIVSAVLLLISPAADAAVKSSVISGNWNNPSAWSPTGIPSPSDEVIISDGTIVELNDFADVLSVTVNTSGEFNLTAGKQIVIQQTLTVNGKMKMNGGNISFSTGAQFNMGAYSIFTWDPGINSPAGATLFTKGVENFDSTSTLIIKKWYDYSTVPIGKVVTGNFGNLTLNSLAGNVLLEWNQDNYFESHKIIGTLTIDQGWIVLDKSGQISNTSIGNINLLNGNSYLDFHNGSHSSTFVVNAGSITNMGGGLNGIYNGNGNVELNVSGNFTNYGNVVLIYNTGVFNVGNGDAKMTVLGNYTQNTGDFRGIFNLTTFNAGTVELTFNNITVTGGIMMGHYACHTSAETNNFIVNGNLNINFQNPSAKFRVTGLTSLSGTFNNVKSNIFVSGNFSISGNTSSEFTSSGSIGSETVNVIGNVVFSGGSNNFNMGSHQVSSIFNGDLVINGGNTSLSKTPGALVLTILKDLKMNAGLLSIKGNTGAATIKLEGNYIQTGGTLFLHSNTNFPSADLVSISVAANFSQTGGIINYEDNGSSASQNMIVVKGTEYTVGGNALITRAGNAFGLLRFSSQGMLVYKRITSTHNIQQVKQVVDGGCTLEIANGNLQIASSMSPALDMLRVLNGSILKMGTSKIVSNIQYSHSGITVENGARMTTQNANGLYNGTDNACINATGNVNYFLSPNSIIEYNGIDNQEISGINTGLATTNNHKYGILEINFTGTPDIEKVSLNNPNVYVRTALVLTSGEVYLNNNPITIEDGNTTAVSRNTGYIKSDNGRADNNGFIRWMNMTTGEHIFPFAFNAADYLPFIFSPVSGMGETVSVATRATGIDNMPFPVNNLHVNSITRNGKDIAVSSVIDRYFEVRAPGYKANTVVMYRGAENTTADSLNGTSFGIQSWDGHKWSNSFGLGIGVKQGIGTITVNNATLFNHWIISTITSQSYSNDFIDFTAKAEDNHVLLDWSTGTSTSINYFNIEKSNDDLLYVSLGQVLAQPNSGDATAYSYTDSSIVNGTFYYRISQVNNDGTVFVSHTERVEINLENDIKTEILTLSPNPFSNYFELVYSSSSNVNHEILITNSLGSIISIEKLKSDAGINSYKFYQKQNLAPGIYVVTLRSGKNAQSRKLFKN